MSSVQPRTLSNTEIIRLSAIELDMGHDLPVDWQRELLRRFVAIAPLNEHPLQDETQLDLFTQK